MYKSLIALSLLVAYTTAFPSGAPQGACSTRVPLHGVDPQTSNCPYDFVALPWKQGEFTNLGVFPTEENSPLQFRGLLASVFHNGQPIGEMRLVDPTQNTPNDTSLKLTCDGTSITHGNRDDKNEVFFEWKAPMDLLDDDVVELRLTVVQTQPIFWVDCNKIQVRRGDGTTTTSSSSTSTSTTTEAPRRASTRRTPVPTQPQRTPAPTQRTPAPTQRTPAPTQRRPAPTQRTPAPTQRTPAPTQRTPASRPRPPPTLAAETEVTESTSASTSSSTSTTTAAPRTRAPIRTTTRAPIRTQPPTTTTTRRAPIRTRPPTTATTRRTPIRTRPPTIETTRRTPRTRPPPTRAPTKAPTHAPIRTRPPPRPTTRAPMRTRPPPRANTRAPIRTQPPTRATTRTPIRTRPPPRATTFTPLRTRPPPRTGAPITTTRTPARPAPRSSGGFDSYLDYNNRATLKHQTKSDTECMEYGNRFVIVPNTSCREFTQAVIGSRHLGNPIKCPGGTRFDPRVCSCAFTTYCPSN